MENQFAIETDQSAGYQRHQKMMRRCRVDTTENEQRTQRFAIGGQQRRTADREQNVTTRHYETSAVGSSTALSSEYETHPRESRVAYAIRARWLSGPMIRQLFPSPTMV